MVRGRPKEMIRLTPNKTQRFDEPKTITVSYPNGTEYEFRGVIAILKEESGFLFLEKHDGGFAEIPPSYYFFEVADSTDS